MRKPEGLLVGGLHFITSLDAAACLENAPRGRLHLRDVVTRVASFLTCDIAW
jgi:hypothetical protein